MYYLYYKYIISAFGLETETAFPDTAINSIG